MSSGVEEIAIYTEEFETTYMDNCCLWCWIISVHFKDDGDA